MENRNRLSRRERQRKKVFERQAPQEMHEGEENEWEDFNWEGFEVVDELSDVDESPPISERSEKGREESASSRSWQPSRKARFHTRERWTRDDSRHHESEYGRSHRNENDEDSLRYDSRRNSYRRHTSSGDRNRNHDRKDTIFESKDKGKSQDQAHRGEASSTKGKDKKETVNDSKASSHEERIEYDSKSSSQEEMIESQENKFEKDVEDPENNGEEEEENNVGNGESLLQQNIPESDDGEKKDVKDTNSKRKDSISRSKCKMERSPTKQQDKKSRVIEWLRRKHMDLFDTGEVRESAAIKKVSCRSSWKDFKRVVIVSDGRIQFDASNMLKRKYDSYVVEVLSKPYLALDDLPDFITEHIDLNSPKETLLICSVGTFDMIKLQDFQACQELSDHEPLRYMYIKNENIKDLAKEVIRKAKELKKKLQQLLGMESEVFFTTIFPVNFMIYQKYQIKVHKETTKHELDFEFSISDLKEWEDTILQAINSFNEYCTKTHPSTLSLQLTNHARCFEEETFSKLHTIDGVNLTEEVCCEISLNLNRVLKTYLTVRGRYEKVVFVGDSRLEHIRKAWPVDVRYNCKMLTDPELKLSHLCNTEDPVVKELSTSQNSLIVISLGINDLCDIYYHHECKSHEKLEVPVPAHMFNSCSINHIEEKICSYILRSERNLKAVTYNCDVVFTYMYDFDLLSYQDYIMSKHQKEFNHLIQTPFISLKSDFSDKFKDILNIIELYNDISADYARHYPTRIRNFPSLIPEKVLSQGNIVRMPSSVLYDGVHPAPAKARHMAEMYRMYADKALALRGNFQNPKGPGPRLLHSSIVKCRRRVGYKFKPNGREHAQDRQNVQSQDVYGTHPPRDSKDKGRNTPSHCPSTSSHNVEFRPSLPLSPKRGSSGSPSRVLEEKQTCSKLPSALLSDISESDSCDPFDEINSNRPIQKLMDLPLKSPSHPEKEYHYPKSTKTIRGSRSPPPYSYEVPYYIPSSTASNLICLTSSKKNCKRLRAQRPVTRCSQLMHTVQRKTYSSRSPSSSGRRSRSRSASPSSASNLILLTSSEKKCKRLRAQMPVTRCSQLIHTVQRKSYSSRSPPSSGRRSRSRSASPSLSFRKYKRSMSSTTHKSYSRSPPPSKRDRRYSRSSFYALQRKSFSKSPSSSEKSYSSSSSRSPSPSKIRYARSSSYVNTVESKALASLHEVHDRECAVYRKHPAAHPDYQKEFRIYEKKKHQCIINLGGDPNAYDITKDWEKFWSSRLEELLEVSWVTKRDKCLAMLYREKSTEDSSPVLKGDVVENKIKEKYSKDAKQKRKKKSRSRSSSSSDSTVTLRQKEPKTISESKRFKSRVKDSFNSPETKRKYSDKEMSDISSNDEKSSGKYDDSETERKMMNDMSSNEKIEDNYDYDSESERNKMSNTLSDDYDYNSEIERNKPSNTLSDDERMSEKCDESGTERNKVRDVLSGDEQIQNKCDEDKVETERNKIASELGDVSKDTFVPEHQFLTEAPRAMQQIMNVQPVKEPPRLEMLAVGMRLNEQEIDRCDAQAIENSLEELRYTSLSKSVLQPTSREESADEVTSTTPSFEEGKHRDVMEVLEILNRLSEKLGVLKIPLRVVYDKALQYKSVGIDSSKILNEKDTMTLLYMISSKLGKMTNEENFNVIQKVIIQEANERLSHILKAAAGLVPSLDTCLIAEKCLGKNESDTVAYIQSQFLQHGSSEASHDQLKAVYDAVKKEKSKLLTKILRQSNMEKAPPTGNLSSRIINEAPPKHPGSEATCYSPSQLNWSPVQESHEEASAYLSQNQSSLIHLKDEYEEAKSLYSCTSHSDQVTESKLNFQSKQQSFVEHSKPSDVSSSVNPSEIYESPMKSQQAAYIAKLTRNLYGSSSRDYAVEKAVSSGAWLSSTLDYGLPSPSTSKVSESKSLKSHPQSPYGHEAVTTKPMQSDSQEKISAEASSFSSRKDLIRLIIPKAKGHGENIHSASPSMDDSGWQ